MNMRQARMEGLVPCNPFRQEQREPDEADLFLIEAETRRQDERLNRVVNMTILLGLSITITEHRPAA